MKISNNWLKDYIKTELKTERIGEFLTDIGLEVEGIEKFESIKGSLEGIVVGKVVTCEKHPNADKLKKTTVKHRLRCSECGSRTNRSCCSCRNKNL